MLQEAGIRIDAVGLQSHFIVGQTPGIDNQISNMEAFTGLRVEAELDIRLQEPETTSNLKQQSTNYKTTVGACV